MEPGGTGDSIPELADVADLLEHVESPDPGFGVGAPGTGAHRESI